MTTEGFSYALPSGPIGTVRTFEEIVEPSPTSLLYGPGSTVSFDIPCGRKNTFLDPSKTFLAFTLNNTCQVAALTTSAAQLDGSATSVIRRLRLIDKQGGSNLELIDEYASLMSLRTIANAEVGSLSGFRSGPEGFLPYRAQFSAAGLLTWSSPQNSTGVPQGQYFERTTTASQVTSTANASVSNSAPAYCNASTQTFAIPLLSAIGLLGDKYIPVHKLTRDMRLDLTLNEASAVFKRSSGFIPAASTVSDKYNQTFPNISTLLPFPNVRDIMEIPGYTMTNVRLHIGYVQVDDDTVALIEKQTGGVYRWAGMSYQFFRNKTNFTTLNNSFNIPARLSSARTVFSIWREIAAQFLTVPAYTASFPRAYTTSFQYQLGSKYLPQRAVAATTLAIRYFLDCFGSYVDRVKRGGGAAVTLITASQDESVFNPTTLIGDNIGTYCMAVDLGGPCGNHLETFMGGAQTLGLDLQLNTTHLVAPTQSAVGYYCDSYVQHDVLFEIDADGNFSATN